LDVDAISPKDIDIRVESICATAPVSSSDPCSDSTSDTKIAYLSHSNKLLVANGPELKVFDSSSGATDWSSFSNYAREPEDVIALSLPYGQLTFCLKNLSFAALGTAQSRVVCDFLDLLSGKAYDGNRVLVPYVLGFQAVRILLNMAVNQYQQLEGFGKCL
jgi:hypothetical protein